MERENRVFFFQYEKISSLIGTVQTRVHAKKLHPNSVWGELQLVNVLSDVFVNQTTYRPRLDRIIGTLLYIQSSLIRSKAKSMTYISEIHGCHLENTSCFILHMKHVSI